MFQNRNEKAIKAFKTNYNVELKEDQIKMVDRYYSIKQSNQKARFGMQDKLLEQICSKLQVKFDLKRLNQRMRQEQAEYFKEQKKIENQELMDKMDNFIKGRKKEIEVLKYVIQ